MKILDVPQSGSLGGQTSSRNRGGQYRRNRISPSQPPGTGRRSQIREAFAEASSGFSALTTVQQDAWNTFADSYPYVDALGQSIKLTGHQMYVAVATALLNAGETPISDPPVNLVIGALAPVTLVPDASSGITVTWTAGDAADFVLIALSPQLPGARRFNKTFRQFAVAGADDATATVTKAAYEAEFGTLTVGQRIFMRATPVNSDGLTGPATILSALVVA